MALPIRLPPESNQDTRWVYEELIRLADYIVLLEERLLAAEEKLDNS